MDIGRLTEITRAYVTGSCPPWFTSPALEKCRPETHRLPAVITNIEHSP